MQRFEIYDTFDKRHIGPSPEETSQMCRVIGVESVDELINKTIPPHIRLKTTLQVPGPLTEFQYLEYIHSLGKKNKIAKSYIGLGYYPTITPPVIQRNILENPGWYTQYTPYQAEIAQGRLEALFNFQTMIVDLTGLPIANASLLDEATAAAEAMLMFNAHKKDVGATKFFIDEEVFPQTLEVVKTRAYPKDIEIVVGDALKHNFTNEYFGILLQFPNAAGNAIDYTQLIASVKTLNIQTVVAADLLSLALFTPPGEIGANAVVGSTQRFGVPMGYGGPHAGFLSTTEDYKRSIPGRIIGQSIDAQGKPAFRMALQTREQHIKREKATSNICTAQVLLSVMASMYAVYHGPNGIREISSRIHALTSALAFGLKRLGYTTLSENFFDTLTIVGIDKNVMKSIHSTTEEKLINFNYPSDGVVGIALSEVTTLENVVEILQIFADANGLEFDWKIFTEYVSNVPETSVKILNRTSAYLTHPIFNSYRSETELMRYIKRLENKDISLVHSMIALGSCTMKLNAAAEMMGVTLPEFGNIHPFAPKEQAQGYKELIGELECSLAGITGFAGVSMQPNSGAQGEYAGLLVIRFYQESRGQGHRKICLIPSSAHGTNPASAVMAGYDVVVVRCDEMGNIDVADLKAKAELHKDNLAALMVTYPSTHGVFEESIVDICETIHSHGGQVYMDGANMNAQVGLTSPALIGADVCHLNLHKTFAIPHGGGGPGMGPICVAEHLVPFLPSHPFAPKPSKNSDGLYRTVSAAPFGSASILIISLGYIMMLGERGLTNATKFAIFNANYLKARLIEKYPVLYVGTNGTVAHECIFDMREFKRTAGIEVEDIAKRLMDYGFHAPTVSFPVAGTLMVEPTESEAKAELDRFTEAMLLIRAEIAEIENGTADKANNVLKNAPHTQAVVVSDEWNRPYSRKKAAFPMEGMETNKFWPSVSRVNNAHGDRNLVCSCAPISEYVQ